MMWIQEWKTDVKAMETEVRGLKKRLRNDWANYSEEIIEKSFVHKNGNEYKYKERKEAPGYDQSKLAGLKTQLSMMYQYRALNRNKPHSSRDLTDLHTLKVNMKKYEDIKAQEIELRKVAQTILDMSAIAEIPLG